MINVMECTITSGRDPDDVSPASQLSFGIFHPVLREFQMQCDTTELCEEWCKCLSLQDAKVKLDDFELLTVIGQVSVRVFTPAPRVLMHIMQGSFGKVVRARKKGTSDL
jgi:hypothetical protein